jgi:hypothetical protein
MASRKSTRQTTTTTVRRTTAVSAAEPEAVEAVGGGIGIDEGIVLTTFLLLVGAIVLVYLALGAYPATT